MNGRIVTGSKNAMSYNISIGWLMMPFEFFKRSQKRNIYEQYEHGARMFDIKIRFDEEEIPIFVNDGIEYYSSHTLFQTLNFLDHKAKSEKVYVSITLDTCGKATENELELFDDIVEEVLRAYKNFIVRMCIKEPSVVVVDNFDLPIIDASDIAGKGFMKFLPTIMRKPIEDTIEDSLYGKCESCILLRDFI